MTFPGQGVQMERLIEHFVMCDSFDREVDLARGRWHMVLYDRKTDISIFDSLPLVVEKTQDLH